MRAVEDFVWEQAGGAYYAVCEGRIAAILYWYGPEQHYLHGPDGDEPPRSGWFLVLAEHPDEHLALDAPEPRAGETLADLETATRTALEAATRTLRTRVA